MKNYKSKLLQATLLIALIIGISSCMNNKVAGTKEVSEGKIELKFDNTNSEKDAQFLVDAAAINHEAISLGKLAQQKGSIKHVKEFGKMIEDASTKSLVELTALATTKNIPLPAYETIGNQYVYKKLNEKSGNEFGREYSDRMVKRHKDAVALFEKASTDSSDPDIRAWSIAKLPTLRKHLGHSVVCQNECAKSIASTK